MDEKLEILKAENNSIDDILDIKDNPVVRAMISLIKTAPIIGDLVDDSISATLSDYQKKKETELINYIVADKTNKITSNQVNDIEFIFNFAKTVDAVRRLATNDKVKYFGNLIKNGYLAGNKIEESIFEEYFEILGTLSMREIMYLTAYKQYLDKLNAERKKQRKTIIFDGYVDFCKHYSVESGVEERVINSVFTRLVKTGFLDETYNTYFGTKNGCDASDLRVCSAGYVLCKSFYEFYDVVLKLEEDE